MLRRLAAALVLLTGLAVAAPSTLLLRAHAHNDYQHVHPLTDALSYGYCSVEADVHVRSDALLVAHDAAEVQAGRTLQALYLDPLRARVLSHGGHVYAEAAPFTLLVEFKDDGNATWTVFERVIAPYHPWLTRYDAEGRHEGAVSLIITGHVPRQAMAAAPVRYAACDGDLDDLGSGVSPDLVPWVSSDWKKSFHWEGKGPIPYDDAYRLEHLVAQAHADHRKLRFWDAPDTEPVWSVLYAAGVDLINTDDLPGLQRFLSSRSR
ncbi:MAG TPA: phosphatidylinositol-specific phospholipase C/glycerophosphodiester phosphodiesterase family protein [Candidatus Xenobia bacterium]